MCQSTKNSIKGGFFPDNLYTLRFVGHQISGTHFPLPVIFLFSRKTSLLVEIREEGHIIV